jgi:hypothetical protein
MSFKLKPEKWQGKKNMSDGKQNLMQRLRSWWQGLVAIPGVDLPVVEAAAAQITNELGGTIVQAMDKITALHDNMANLHGESMQNIGEAMQRLNAPKKVIRGADGLVIGVETA